MDKTDRLVSFVFVFFTWFSIIAALYIAIITVANVITRYFFSLAIWGSQDTSSLALSIVALGSLPVVTMFNGHIKVDLIVNNFSQKAQKWFSYANLFLCAGMMSVMSFFTFLKMEKVLKMKSVTQALSIPYWPFYLIIAVMLGFASLCAIYNLVHIAITGCPVTAATFDEVKGRIKGKREVED